jgi:hypothetical protein
MATARATDTAKEDDPDHLVMEIMDVQEEMDGKDIDFSCYRVMLEHIIKSLASSAREESAKKLRKLLDLHMKKLRANLNEAHSIAAGAIGAQSLPAGAYGAQSITAELAGANHAAKIGANEAHSTTAQSPATIGAKPLQDNAATAKYSLQECKIQIAKAMRGPHRAFVEYALRKYRESLGSLKKVTAASLEKEYTEQAETTLPPSFFTGQLRVEHLHILAAANVDIAENP